MPIKEKLEIKQLNLEIFGGCNYQCPICPQSSGREKSFLKKMDYDLFEKVVCDASIYGLEAVSLHGSGEPTLHPDLPRMVAFLTNRNLFSSLFTNGSRLTPDLFGSLVDSGIGLVRISMYGYDRESYKKFSNKDNFDLVVENYKLCQSVLVRLKKPLEILQTWHMISDIGRQEQELESIRSLVKSMNAKSEVWLLHNWSGTYAAPYHRGDLAPLPQLRSCGRPFAPTLEVRAGGLGSGRAAVVPCPNVLGRDSEAVMGHLDKQTIEEVVSGDAYENLRKVHEEKRFSDISYCANCDQLYNLPTALVWTNIEGRFYGQSRTSTVVYNDHIPQN